MVSCAMSLYTCTGLLLADAVGAVGGLILRSHVPPRVVVDDDIGRGQVQAGAAARSEIRNTLASPR